MISTDTFKNKVPPQLTPEQETSPYASIYYRPVAQPSDEVLEALGETQIDPSLALDYSDIYKAFLPESMPADNGWCIRPDGTGYSTVRIRMPEVTLKMEKWWYGWFKDPSFDYLNYKIWMPGWHVSHANPLIEDAGWGNVKIYSDGFTDERILNLPDNAKNLDPDFMHAVVSSGISIPENDPEGPAVHNSLIKIYKKQKKGIQVQAFNLLGVRITENGFEKVHDAQEEMVRMFAWHNAYECNRMGDILPELYKIASGERT